MGDISEMMMEGLLCQSCGVYMGDEDDDDYEAPGYPVTCEDCKSDV